jgi:Universal stress protein family
MYSNILIPTDGSDLAGKAVQYGIALAQRIGVRATVLTVVPPFQLRGANHWSARIVRAWWRITRCSSSHRRPRRGNPARSGRAAYRSRTPRGR